MSTPESRYPLRPPRRSPEANRGSPPNPRTETRSDMVIDRDVEVVTRAGRTVQADVYRPVSADPAAVIIADIPGTWHARGPASYISPEEAEDFYDLIEWAGVQNWSNGRVGLSGVSYLTVAQWQVAALNPPHLAAINPWEDHRSRVRRRELV